MRTFFLLLAFVPFFSCGSGAEEQQEGGQSLPGIAPHQDQAIAAVTELLEKDSRNASLWVQRAQLFYEKGGYDEAIMDMASAMKIDSVTAEYHHLLADIYMDYFKSRLALATMQRAAALHPQRIATLLKLCEIQLILKMNQESMETIDKVLRIDPQNADAYFMFGLNFKELGDTARAVGSFQKAVEFEPALTDAWINLAQLRAARKEPNAIRFFDAAILSDTANAQAWMSKADYQWEQGDLRGAIATYRSLIGVEPENANAYYNIGLVYMELDSFVQARDHFNITVNHNQLYYKAFYYRGLAAEKLGDLKAARADYEHAVKMAPNFDKAREALAALDAAQ